MVNQPSPPPCFTIQGAAFHSPLPWPGAEAPGGPVGPVPSARREADGDPPSEVRDRGRVEETHRTFC